MNVSEGVVQGGWVRGTCSVSERSTRLSRQLFQLRKIFYYYAGLYLIGPIAYLKTYQVYI